MLFMIKIQEYLWADTLLFLFFYVFKPFDGFGALAKKCETPMGGILVEKGQII